MRMAHEIEPGFVVKTDRVNNECISLPLANRVPHPRGSHILGMLTPICVDLAHKVIVLKEHDHPARDLNNLDRLPSLKIDTWDTGGGTVRNRGVGFRQGGC